MRGNNNYVEGSCFYLLNIKSIKKMDIREILACYIQINVKFATFFEGIGTLRNFMVTIMSRLKC